MILPAKHLRHDRALLEVGAEILAEAEENRTVSELWERVRVARAATNGMGPLSFDWFVLSLSFLYTISALEFAAGVVTIRAGR
jgi:ABC-3C biological conflict system middle component